MSDKRPQGGPKCEKQENEHEEQQPVVAQPPSLMHAQCSQSGYSPHLR